MYPTCTCPFKQPHILTCTHYTCPVKYNIHCGSLLTHLRVKEPYWFHVSVVVPPLLEMECFAVGFWTVQPDHRLCMCNSLVYTVSNCTSLLTLTHAHKPYHLLAHYRSCPCNIPLCSGELSSFCAGCSPTVGLVSLTAGLLRASISLLHVGGGLVRRNQYRNTSLSASSGLSSL